MDPPFPSENLLIRCWQYFLTLFEANVSRDSQIGTEGRGGP